MLKFYLIRHGEKKKIQGDPSLTILGQKQAETTGEFFINKNIDYIFTSPSKRTIQTADIIAKKLGLSATKDKRLKERMNWGDKQGETLEEFIMEWQKTDIDRNYQPPHGDSSIVTGNRLKSVLDELSMKYNHANTLIVTHGGTIGDLLRNEFHEKDLVFLTNPISKARYIDILECSITIVNKNGNKYLLETLGNRRHIPPSLI